MLVGYARVSSTGQELDSQIKSLNTAGVEKIFTEKKSGKSANERQELQNALEFVREGDTLHVTRLDRLARSVNDLHNILEQLKQKGVAFNTTEQDLDTSSPTGRLMVGLLALIAEFETDLRAERQADGIKAAKERGVHFGRVRKMTNEQVKEAIELQNEGWTGQKIAEYFEVGRSTLLREIKKDKENY